jgi:predicted phosphodiesterase
MADERAERDETIGHFQLASTHVDVKDGLAVVREADSTHVVFWSGAPIFTATVRATFTSTFEVEVRNLVAGSTLRATGPDGKTLTVELIDESLPTRRRFAVTPVSDTLQLELVPPKATDNGKFYFAVLSDIQAAIDRVQDIYGLIAKERDVDFVLSVGDLTDNGTRGQLYQFESELEKLPIPFYSTIGNHELFYSELPKYQDVFGRTSFHFDYRGAAFSFVDSAAATISPLVRTLLDEWLEANRSRVHVVATHIPAIDPIGIRGGSFASQIEAHQFIASLAKGRVDMAIYGHIHSYYKFKTAGVTSYISGGGGGRPELLSGTGRHYLVVEVGPKQIESVRKVDVD